jgi:hypothetical protein
MKASRPGVSTVSTVAGPYPGDGVEGQVVGQDGQAGQRHPGPAMTAQAPNLDVLPRPGPLQNGLEHLDYGFGVCRHAEVRPILLYIACAAAPTGGCGRAGRAGPQTPDWAFGRNPSILTA